MKREVSDEVCNAARDRVRRLLAARPDLRAEDLAQHTALAACTVRLWLSGGMPGGREVVGQMTRVAELVEAGEILRPGGRQEAIVIAEDSQERATGVARQGNFYSTSTVRRVAEVLDYCAANSAIGLCTADFGAGKTEAVKDWRRTTAGKVESVVFEFDEFSSHNVVDFVCVMGRQLGIDLAAGSQNGGRVFRELCDCLRRNPCLLIFDQTEGLRPRVCQVIRQLWDRTNDAGVGVVMLAAPILLARLNKLPDLGALASRVGIFAPLSG
jgi:hypothetical protein